MRGLKMVFSVAALTFVFLVLSVISVEALMTFVSWESFFIPISEWDNGIRLLLLVWVLPCLVAAGIVADK